MKRRSYWIPILAAAVVLCSATAIVASVKSRLHSEQIEVVDVTAPEVATEILLFDPFESSSPTVSSEPVPNKVENEVKYLNQAIALFNEGAETELFTEVTPATLATPDTPDTPDTPGTLGTLVTPGTRQDELEEDDDLSGYLVGTTIIVAGVLGTVGLGGVFLRAQDNAGKGCQTTP